MQAYVGFEIHVELKTKSKMFCACPVPTYDLSLNKPNTFICPICVGHPGTLPSLNKKAVEHALKVALALNTSIAPSLFFSRKNYFYPDLPKNYQVSQHQTLLGVEGEVSFPFEGKINKVKIKDIHLEEDTAKLLYPEGKLKGATAVLIDFNRSGVPLLELVTYPFLATPQEGRAFLEELQRIIRFLGAGTGNMEEGALRIDTNVSLPDKNVQPGVKTEIKNLNSFKSVERALIYEIERQKNTLNRGEVLSQETRGFLEKEGITVLQRRKEEASDYRYFPDPDLPALPLEQPFLESIKFSLTSLPGILREELIKQGLKEEHAFSLTKDPETFYFFKDLVEVIKEIGEASSWILNEVLSLFKEGKTILELPFSPQELGEVILKVRQGEYTRGQIKEALKVSLDSNQRLNIILEKMPPSVSSSVEIYNLVVDVLEEERSAVEDYLVGKDQAFNYLLGKVIKLSAGRADPVITRKILEEELKKLR